MSPQHSTPDTTQVAPAHDFVAGQPVRYVPYHAEGDASHKDCQNGYVSSLHSDGVHLFVRFSLGGTAQRCHFTQLV